MSNKINVRFLEIDLLRFLAAISVLFFHYTFQGFRTSDFTLRTWFPAYSTIFKYGYLGVPLFFMISGFVILMSAIDKTQKNFIISRIVRLYPAFWVCCSLTFFMTIFIGKDLYHKDPVDWLINLTMLNNYFDVPAIDGAYWTLYIEMKFYFFIFVLILFRQIHNIKYYLGFWLILSLFNYVHQTPRLEDNIFPQYSPYFISGSIFFLLHKDGPCIYKYFILLTTLTLSLLLAVKNTEYMTTHYQSIFNFGISSALIIIFYLIFFLIAKNKINKFRLNFFGFLGSLTYPLYLIHENVGLMIIYNLQSTFNKFILLFGTIALMILLAWIIHVLIEKKFSPILKRFLEDIKLKI